MKGSVLVCCVLVAVIAPGSSSADSPTDAAQQLVDSMRNCGLIRAASVDDVPCDYREIEDKMAIAQLAKWLLGPYWAQIGPDNQAGFTTLFTRLLREVAFPTAADFLAGTRVEYSNGKMDGKDAIVETTVVNPDEGQVKIGYRLHEVKGKWRVWDVYLDGVSMAGNLRKQIQAVIAKKSYQELEARLRQKLEEAKRVQNGPGFN